MELLENNSARQPPRLSLQQARHDAQIVVVDLGRLRTASARCLKHLKLNYRAHAMLCRELLHLQPIDYVVQLA